MYFLVFSRPIVTPYQDWKLYFTCLRAVMTISLVVIWASARSWCCFMASCSLWSWALSLRIYWPQNTHPSLLELIAASQYSSDFVRTHGSLPILITLCLHWWQPPKTHHTLLDLKAASQYSSHFVRTHGSLPILITLCLNSWQPPNTHHTV